MIKGNGRKSTARKPLVDISNGKRPSRISKKTTAGDGVVDDDTGALDRLLLVRSDISNIFGEIDELIAGVLGNKTVDRKANQDIESFRNILSDMHSSLKPWVSKLRKASGSTSAPEEKKCGQTIRTTSISCVDEEADAFPNKNESELDIVSPSPLVSWRAGSCTFETGKQLFLLTPLPKNVSSKFPASSKSTMGVLRDKNQHGLLRLQTASTFSESKNVALPEKLKVGVPTDILANPFTVGLRNNKSGSTHVSPLKSQSNKESMTLLTPCPKTVAQKCSVLHDAVTENIPEPPTEDNGSKGSDGLTTENILDGLASRYQELLGLGPSDNMTNRRKEISQTLDWFLSPPKSCAILEPTEEKPVPSPVNNSMLLLATPLWKDVESTVQKGKRPGETTLKKELWTRFEKVSKDGLHFTSTIFQKTEPKRFLDMLEEACETSDCGHGK